MRWQQLFVRKTIEQLHAEMKGENRLRRVLGPIALTSLGVGAIIGAGIFVTTGEAAADKAGPAVMIAYAVAGLGCALAALCYAEFAAMAPVAGSAYTYAYATLGELLAWIIGWDLILEYAMSCAVLAADWTKYFNEFIAICFRGWRFPARISTDFLTAWEAGDPVSFNLLAVLIMALCTAVLVIGIRESATTNAILVGIKVGVVLFVIAVGVWYISPANWSEVPPTERPYTDTGDLLRRRPDLARLVPEDARFEKGRTLLQKHPHIDPLVARPVLGASTVGLLGSPLGQGPFLAASALVPGRTPLLSEEARREVTQLPSEEENWGAISVLGLHHWLEPLDDKVRSPFIPFGLSGIMVAAAAVFFAYIGFDAISTHAEEAKRPQHDVPIGILASLGICTVLYFGVSAVITGMEPYPQIDREAAVAVAFRRLSEHHQSLALRLSAGLIAIGALAGMTSVILITFLSQARIFLAMARDGLLPPAIFGAVHPRFRTPHRATILTGIVLCAATALLPVGVLLYMVNIGTLLAFIIVCASVLLLRLRRPDAPRPFRCPAVFVLAPLGIFVNLAMMLFLPLDTWFRLFGWLALGLIIYFAYGRYHSALGKTLMAKSPS